jgi:CubicO group peptidase (beta-lactamase class C family)
MAAPLSKGCCPDEEGGSGAEQAGLDAGQLNRIVPELAAYLRPAPVHPWCAGAVVLAGRGRTVALHEAVGWAVRYARYDEQADRGVELPREQWVPMRADTVVDLASLTKLFTAVAAVQQIEYGALRLDAAVAEYTPVADRRITVRHLLTHTSGLRPELPLYDLPDASARAAALAAEEPLTPPGASRRYSDLNLLLLQTVLERVADRPLDRLIADGVTGPLGMADTRFNPPASWLPRIAAMEDQRKPWGKLDRGMVHGTVHDENAYAMGGVAGHAGLFSTAWDLALFARALLDGGAGILRTDSTALLLGGVAGPDRRRRPLGFEADQPWFMGELAGRGAVGHTGFTGTSVVLDPATDTFLVLLANSVHPSRTWRDDSAPRAAAATRLARAAKTP